jgi:CRP-like cAMP-binding protein
MATSPLFKELVPAERRDLVTRFRLRELPAGYDVLTQGQPGDGLHVVLAGELVAYLADEERVLGVLRPGDAFGEMALLSGEPASASVRAVARSWVLRLPAEDFEAIAADHPALRAGLDELARERRAENLARIRTRVRPV